MLGLTSFPEILTTAGHFEILLTINKQIVKKYLRHR
jgi:hypothetical protein